MNFIKLFSSLSKLCVEKEQVSGLKIANVWTEVRHVEHFGESQMMKMEDGSMIFLSVGLDTTKVFVARDMEALESFNELASFEIVRSDGDRRKRGDAILGKIRTAVGWPKSVEELRRNLEKINPGQLKKSLTDEAEDLYEFGRKNRIKDMNKSWLRRKLTPEEEAALYLRVRTGSPSGAIIVHLQNFLTHRQDGDELWDFDTSDESWKMMAGRAGIAMVRNGEIFDRITTRMN